MEKLLGVVIDKNLLLTHISKLCKKAGNKLFALARIAGYMNHNKLRTLTTAFVISQFPYYPLVWMLHGRHLNNTINRMHRRSLRISHKDYQSTFKVLLENDCTVNMHVKHLQTLMVELFKIRDNLKSLQGAAALLHPCFPHR